MSPPITPYEERCSNGFGKWSASTAAKWPSFLLREELRTKTRTDHNKAKANKSVKHVEVEKK